MNIWEKHYDNDGILKGISNQNYVMQIEGTFLTKDEKEKYCQHIADRLNDHPDEVEAD